ncbi:MAG TPA: peptidoglycan editing factor PgeF [Anaerolineae bacterium]|nr:peptidoglycan editing factor PgeF [Anaerolineae bacterium]
MHREISGDLVTYRFHSLPAEHLSHAVFTRLGGVSRLPFATLNVGNSVGDELPATTENHARIFRYMGISPNRVVTAQQVHGNHVALATEEDAGRVLQKTDGLVTQSARLALMLRFADCQPVLLYDRARHALGLFHVGWRGLAQGMVRRALEAMGRSFGSEPRDLLAALGPAIGPCCYEVGDDVATAMGYSLPDWRRVMRRDGARWRLDLSAGNADQLTDAGVAQIEQAGICTCCGSSEFFSHRADKGLTGRFAVVAYLRERLAHEVSDLPQGEPPRKVSPSVAFPASLHPRSLPGFGEHRISPQGGKGEPGGRL